MDCELQDNNLIRPAEKCELNKCLEIARNLPDWFNDDELIDIEISIKSLTTYVYICENTVVGFICVKDKFDSVLELVYLGVDKDQHHKGIGTALINHIESNIAAGRVMMLKTIDSSPDYPAYDQTRAYYEKLGFIKIETIAPYPGWAVNCPCAIYIKRLKL